MSGMIKGYYKIRVNQGREQTVPSGVYTDANAVIQTIQNSLGMKVYKEVECKLVANEKKFLIWESAVTHALDQARYLKNEKINICAGTHLIVIQYESIGDVHILGAKL